MELENNPLPQQDPPTTTAPETSLPPEPPVHAPATRQFAWLQRIFIGGQGLRAGWSAVMFIALSLLFLMAMVMIVGALTGLVQHGEPKSLSPFPTLISEAAQVLAILAAAGLMARIEGRRILDFYLTGPRSFSHFLGGLTAGFVALSVLVGALASGGWLRFGPVALSGTRIIGFAVVWAVVFLLTGFFEEGGFRCYLQFTLTRGINFWWALGLVGAICLDLALRVKGNGVWGVYIIALLGLVPCLLLHLKRTSGAGFWQAAWVTSTLFGFAHTSNNGENWIGIFSAAAIGFIFCVSIWVTGSAWWAIGCHMAWDWAETFFYGTADSGLVPKGHFLTTSPAGNAFWSGGTDGPEGSVLIIGVLVLLLLTLLLIYGRKRALPEPAQAAEQLAS